MSVKRKSKYEAAAEKSLKTFLKELNTSSLTSPSDDIDGSLQSDSDQGEADDDQSSALEVSGQHSLIIESHESDATTKESSSESEAELEHRHTPSPKKKRKLTSDGRTSIKTSPKQKETLAKPEDAPKGTAAEEDRIKKLKNLLSAAGTSRPFNTSTGAERTLPVTYRLSHLSTLLQDVGLKVGTGVAGLLPSLAKAREVGEKRELEKEMKDLQGVPILEGLRDGKRRTSTSGVPSSPFVEEEEDHGDEDESSRESLNQKLPGMKFGAFLGDQSDSSS